MTYGFYFETLTLEIKHAWYMVREVENKDI